MAYDDEALANRWSHLSAELFGVRRRAVISALQHSAESGWPASPVGEQLLVAYALGHIDAQEYAVQVIISLDLDRTAAAPAAQAPLLSPGELAAVPDAAPLTASSDWLYGPLGEIGTPEPVIPPEPVATPSTVVQRLSREDAVQAYVSGQIPVEEFLRIARGVSA